MMERDKIENGEEKKTVGKVKFEKHMERDRRTIKPGRTMLKKKKRMKGRWGRKKKEREKEL